MLARSVKHPEVYNATLYKTYEKYSLLIYLYPASFIISNSSCKKEETLKNRGFTAKVDGKKWEAKSPDFKLGPYEAHLTRGDSTLQILARNDDSRINIFVLGNLKNKKIEPGTYLLNKENLFDVGSFDDFVNKISYDTKGSNIGSITITAINKNTKIITGTFEFNASSSNSSKTIKINDGKFNIPYINY